MGTFILGRFAFYLVFWGNFDTLKLQLKVMLALGSFAINRYEEDLSNELLSTLVDFLKNI